MTPAEAGMLARVDERTRNTGEKLEQHVEADDVRFERTFTYVKESFTKMDAQLTAINARLGTLWDNNNKQEGAFGAGKWVAGIVGGALVALIDFWTRTHGGSSPP